MRRSKATFPQGGYGAGHVDIWDHGSYEPNGSITAGLDAGKVEFNLHGEKLRGRFALIRMGRPGPKENWLLIKMKDEFAQADSTAVADERPAPKKASRSTKKNVPVPTGRVKAGSTGKSERVKFTHVDKMMFPEAGLTKGKVLDFYDAVADYLIPHLKDRPVTLERLPDGLATPDAPRFWQKNTPAYYPSWVPRVKLPSETGKPVQYALVNDRNILLYLVNQGAMTFHPFLSCVESLDRPDMVLFDLDPGDALFDRVVTIAKKLRELLDAEKATAYLKTSGKSGLHILTPWREKGGYDESRQWASQIAARAIEALADIATMERSKAARKGRIYVDVIQNARGHHVVPPYVLRAVPEATVSTPLEWAELTTKFNPGRFTPAVVLKRLAMQKVDPMASLVS